MKRIIISKKYENIINLYIENYEKDREIIYLFNSRISKILPATAQFIQMNDVDENEPLSISTNIFCSFQTLKNWMDEITNVSCIGIQVDFGKEQNNVVLNLTSRYESMIDNLNNKNENDMIFPIYICKEHWNIAKAYIPISIMSKTVKLFGDTNIFTSICYSNKMFNLYYSILCNFITLSLSENDKWSKEWIFCMLALLRTCIQISLENKMIKKYDVSSYNIIFGYIYSVGDAYDKELFDLSKKLYDETIHKTLLNNVSDQELIYLHETKPKLFEYEINNKLKYLNLNPIKNDILLAYFGVKLVKYIILLYGSLENFCESVDKKYGVLSDEKFDKITEFCVRVKNISWDEKINIYFSDNKHYNIFSKEYTLSQLTIFFKKN